MHCIASVYNRIVQIDFGLKPKLLIKLLLNFAFLAGLGFKPNL